MSDGSRDLELMVLGACLADPKLREKVHGFAEQRLASLLEEIKAGKRDRLASWLSVLGVKWSSGRAIDAVTQQQNRNRIDSELRRVSFELQVATRLKMTTKMQEALKRMEQLQHEAITAETKAAAEKAGEAQTQPRPVDHQSVSGGQPGVRVQGDRRDHSTRRTLGATRPSSHSENQARPPRVSDKPMPSVS